MNTELTNFTSNEYFNEIASMTGAAVSTAVYLPRLKINRQPTDDNDKPIPVGSFSVSQDDNVLYSKTAIFRPFINAYQYSEYDGKAREYTNRSVIFKNFREEAIDMLGGLACGKVPAKHFNDLTADQQLKQKGIKCTRLLYGTATFTDAVDADGEKNTLDACPVVLRLNGGSFMTPNDALQAITKMKHHFFQHVFELSTKRQKTGDNVYYNILINPILDKTVEFVESDMNTFKLFQETIDRENDFISKKWAEAKRAKVKEQDSFDVAAALSLDDEIPF